MRNQSDLIYELEKRIKAAEELGNMAFSREVLLRQENGELHKAVDALKSALKAVL